MSTDAKALLVWADNLESAPGRIGAEVAQEARSTAEIVADGIRENAPVGETGDLSTDIEVTREGSGRSKDFFVRVTATAKYASFVHYGTSRQKPNPFANRELAAEEPAHVARLTSIVEGVLRDV